MSYAEIRKECDIRGYIHDDEVMKEPKCSLSGQMCNGGCCPVKRYFTKAHKQPGYYRQRSLDKTGLVGAYEKEIAQGGKA